MDKSNNVVAPLGNYITLVTRKNKNLEVTRLVGVTVEKEIVISFVAGFKTNLKICLVIKEGEFVVRLFNVEMTRKLAIGLYEEKDEAIVSSQYHVFKITSSSLNRYYLMLIFKRRITELELLYRCFGGIRGALSWKDFVKLPISIPPLEKQERIVNRYQIVTKYVELKKKINELFEKQMTAYYHVLFDNLIDYTIRNFGEILSIIRGGRPPRGNKEQDHRYFCKKGGIPWLKVGDISEKKYKFISETSEQLTSEGFKRGKCKIVPAESIIFAGSGVDEKVLGYCVLNFCDLVLNTTLWGVIGSDSVGGGTSVPTTYIYFLIKENISKLKRMINSSTDRVSFDIKRFNAFEFKFPPQYLIDKFNNFCEPIFELQKNNEQIIKKLLRVQKCWVESLD